MVFSVITILLCIVPFILFTQPLYFAYAGEGREVLNKIYEETSCYEGMKFDGNETLYTVGAIFMIVSLVMAGLTILLTILNMIGKITNSKKTMGVKICALIFFLSTLTAVALIGIHAGQIMNVKTFDDVLETTVGYGLLGSLIASFLALIFAPKKK